MPHEFVKADETNDFRDDMLFGGRTPWRCKKCGLTVGDPDSSSVKEGDDDCDSVLVRSIQNS